MADVAARVGRLPGHSAAAFLAAANSGRVRSVFSPPGTTSLEGLLQPATYSFKPGTDDLSIVGEMVADFDSQANAIGLAQQAARLKVTPYQAVIVASVIEREAKTPADEGRVAQVVYNRLAKGMPLQLDSTVVYALGGHVTTLNKPDFSIASPYNTYRFPGLPPTPIATPSDAALAAAGASSSPARAAKKRAAARMDRRETSTIERPATVTARLSGLRRAPWQAGQGRFIM